MAHRRNDIFTGVTCYSLQSHLRTSVPGIGQVDTDEVYVGVDRQGAHYVITVRAKGGKGRMSGSKLSGYRRLCREVQRGNL